MRSDGLLSTGDVAARSGLSYRRLDYWIRQGAIRPSGFMADGSGSRRAWTDHDFDRLVIIRRVADLLGTVDVDLAAALWDWLGRQATWPRFVTLMRPDHHWVVQWGVITLASQSGIVVSTRLTGRPVAPSLFDAPAVDGDGDRYTLDAAPL